MPGCGRPGRRAGACWITVRRMAYWVLRFLLHSVWFFVRGENVPREAMLKVQSAFHHSYSASA